MTHAISDIIIAQENGWGATIDGVQCTTKCYVYQPQDHNQVLYYN